MHYKYAMPFAADEIPWLCKCTRMRVLAHCCRLIQRTLAIMLTQLLIELNTVHHFVA